MNRLLFLITALFATAGAYAQEGDAAAGKQLYQAQCLVCHGANGASVIPANPILSAQHRDYLQRQIAAYRDGGRTNAVMAGMAKSLTDQQILDIALYLSQQQAVIIGSADIEQAQAAERLYRGGSLERELPACAACHGPAGDGIAVLAPRISGQYPEYTVAALKAYLNGERQNPQMESISAKLSAQEMEALAQFLSGLAH